QELGLGLALAGTLLFNCDSHRGIPVLRGPLSVLDSLQALDRRKPRAERRPGRPRRYVLMSRLIARAIKIRFHIDADCLPWIDFDFLSLVPRTSRLRRRIHESAVRLPHPSALRVRDDFQPLSHELHKEEPFGSALKANRDRREITLHFR